MRRVTLQRAFTVVFTLALQVPSDAQSSYTCDLDEHATYPSTAERDWCCQHQGRGCDHSFNCDEGLPSWRRDWSIAKKEWCCRTEYKGCQFDCSAGLNNWEAGWSIPKKQWCCEHAPEGILAQLGCSSPYNCDEGLGNYEKLWSKPKKAYCCRHSQKGCDPYECSVGVFTWATSWSEKKKKWCCAHRKLGCDVSTSPPPYDCDQGYAYGVWYGNHEGNAYTKWRDTWSEAKTSYCCKHERRGCALYDCKAGYSNWQAGWSITKKTWCCKYEQRGCPPKEEEPERVRLQLDNEPPFNCRRDHANPYAEWTHVQKEYCCNTEGVGCSGIVTSTSRPVRVFKEMGERHYDCMLGIQNFKDLWSHDKRSWCCENVGVACLARKSEGKRVWFTGQFETLSNTLISLPASRSSFSVLPAITCSLVLLFAAGLKMRMRDRQRAAANVNFMQLDDALETLSAAGQDEHPSSIGQPL